MGQICLLCVRLTSPPVVTLKDFLELRVLFPPLLCTLRERGSEGRLNREPN